VFAKLKGGYIYAVTKLFPELKLDPDKFRHRKTPTFLFSVFLFFIFIFILFCSDDGNISNFPNSTKLD
jgi:hypothetical protein